jgi:lysophospholipase L1-like esterase
MLQLLNLGLMAIMIVLCPPGISARLFHDHGRSLKKPTPPPTPKIKVACVGDSVTDQTCCGLSSTQIYPHQLQTILGEELYEVGEFGNWGYTMIKNGDRSIWNFPELNEAKAFEPDIVIIMLGLNDAKDINWEPYGYAFQSDATEMYNDFLNLPSNPTVFAALPTAVDPFDACCGIRDDVVFNDIIPKVQAAAQESGALELDTYAYTHDHLVDWYIDGVHLNADGAHGIAQFFKTAILNLGGTVAKNTHLN